MRLVFSGYLQRASNEIGFSSVFPDERAFMKTMEMASPKQYRQWRASHERVRGREQLSVGQLADQEVWRFTNALSVVVWLSPITAIKQLSQVVPSALGVPARDALAGFAKAVVPRNRLAAAREGATMRDWNQMMGRAKDQLERAGPMGLAADYASVGAQFVPKYTGIQALDNFVRAFAYLAKKSHLDRLMDDAAAGNVGAFRRLAKEGVDVTPQLVAAAAAGDVRAVARLVKQVKLVSKEYADAKNLRTDLLESPIKLTEPGWSQAMRGLNMFAWQMSRLVWNDLAKPAFNKQMMQDAEWYRHVVYVGKFAGMSLVVGDTIARLEEFLLGRERPKGVMARLVTAASTIGTLGLGDTLFNGLVNKERELIESDRLLPVMALNVSNMISRTLVGSGPSLVTDLPLKLISPVGRRRVVPFVGPWWAESERNKRDR